MVRDRIVWLLVAVGAPVHLGCGDGDETRLTTQQGLNATPPTIPVERGSVEPWQPPGDRPAEVSERALSGDTAPPSSEDSQVTPGDSAGQPGRAAEGRKDEAGSGRTGKADGGEQGRPPRHWPHDDSANGDAVDGGDDHGNQGRSHDQGGGEDAEECSEPPRTAEWRSGLDDRPIGSALALPATLDAAAPGWIAVEAFPAITFNDPISFEEAFDTGFIFVTEREGRIYAFENEPNVSEKRLVLDLADRNQGERDSGLIGFAFHPEFNRAESPNRRYVYLHYAFTPDPVVGSVPNANSPSLSRLARFTVDLDTLQIDPASELVLIDQGDQNLWHQGGAMFFHPKDGFLYLALGDEGGTVCAFRNCQRIDNDLFAGVIRIDVDMRGGDISHPITKQPATGTTANYYIPNDNPFVGQPGVLEEFYALGLRSPHRMTYDALDDITWIGEVGQTTREELNVLQPAANYQWNVLEGTQPGSMEMPDQTIGVWTGPVIELERSEAASIIGGYVYRGSENPYLYGKYIFGDFMTGNIWALSYTYDGTVATPVHRELLVRTTFRGRSFGITSFGVDRNNELYILNLGEEAKIHRLARTGGFSNAPLHLSEVGVFTETEGSLTPNESLVPYGVQSPLWSDGAEKQRWVSLPEGETAEFAEHGSWSFPVGTVFVKHFDLALDETRPDELRRLETRLLVHGADSQYYGLTYKWNALGTDADLLLESQVEPIDVVLANGERRHLQYFYPGPGDCTVCHNPDAGFVLGARTGQLNGDFTYPTTGRTANQIYTWSQTGLLDADLDQATIEQLVSLPSPADEDVSLENRLRSYWAGNCSMCHGTVPDLRADWDARFETPLADQGIIDGPSQSSSDANARLVVPGDLSNSVLYRRSNTADSATRMPPLGRSAIDPAYVAMLEEWILSLAVQESIEPADTFGPPQAFKVADTNERRVSRAPAHPKALRRWRSRGAAIGLDQRLTAR